MKTIFISLVIVGVIIVSVYIYFGGFTKVEFVEMRQGGEIIVFENMIGDYSQAAKVTDKVYYKLLNEEKIVTTRGIGIYYDNPREVDKSKLRSDVGCILEDADSVLVEDLSKKFQIKRLPEGNYLVAEFPFKGALSVMVGVLKVYPAMNKCLKNRGLEQSPVTEIYDIPNKKIIYRLEVR